MVISRFFCDLFCSYRFDLINFGHTSKTSPYSPPFVNGALHLYQNTKMQGCWLRTKMIGACVRRTNVRVRCGVRSKKIVRCASAGKNRLDCALAHFRGKRQRERVTHRHISPGVGGNTPSSSLSLSLSLSLLLSHLYSTFSIKFAH